MQNFTNSKVRIFMLLLLLHTSVYGQLDIFQLMQRNDLRIDQVELLAKKYFDSTGTARGTGYKQYQRWRYEVGFHLNESGFKLPPNYDWETYAQWQKSQGNPITGAEAILNSNNGPWIEKGPFSWNRTGGWNPGVGRLTAIAVDPIDTAIIYVTSPGGGIWKTTNGGATWASLTDANGSWMNMFSIAIDPNNRNTIYAGSNAGILIKSTDGGNTWVGINRSMSNIVGKIIVHPTNSSIVLVAVQNGIFRTTDGGATWTRTFAGVMEDIEFKPNDPNTLYATGQFSPHVVRSVDGGITWTSLTVNNGITHSGRTLVSVSPAAPNKVYVAQANGNEFGRLYVSDDSGISFTTAVTGSTAGCTNFFGYETTGCGTGGQAGYDMAMCVNPQNANEVYLGGIIVFKSIDGGKTFSPQTAWSYPNSIGYNHADIHALEIVGKSLYSASDGGIYISTDNGDNWRDMSSGLGIRQFYRIANSKSNAQLFTGGAQDNGSSIFSPNGWIDWLGADGMDGLISPTNENLVWGTSQNGNLYRSFNKGQSYTTLTRPSAGEWVTPLNYVESEDAIYGGWTGIFKSTDSGATWKSVSGSAISTSLTAMAVAPSNPQFIYASKSTTLFYSSNGGTTWATTTLPSAINAIAVSPTNPSKVWVVCNSTFNRVFVSVNGGSSFTNISANLPNLIGRTIAVDSDADETVYVGMNVGVYYLNNTTNNSWINYTNNLPTAAINDIKIHKAGHLLRIASFGRGVWERPLVGNPPASCGTPTNLAVSNITASSATLSWSAINGANSYTIAYKLAGATAWMVASANHTGNSFVLSGLQAASSYDWRVAANCGNMQSANASSSLQTSISCQAPTSLNTTAITDVSALLSWNTASGAVSYQVEYKTASAENWSVWQANTTATSATITGLLPSTSYQWRVQTRCADGQSAYATMQFSTASPIVCRDVYETNNSSKQAKVITLGTGINASIGTSTDEDWFRVSIANASPTNLKITASQLPADYDIYLYDRNLRLVGASSNSNLTDEVIIFNTKATRTNYFVKVQGKNNSFNAQKCYALQAETSGTPWAPQTGAAYYSDETVEGAVVYPNPANTVAYLKFNSTIEGKATIYITNASGVLIKTQQHVLQNGFNQVTLQVSDLKPGMYLAKLEYGGFRFTKQIVIVR
jgi:Secretion system C-terminal sorting domain/Fibronectin type III domain/Sortilin, neurotensin receptor 3,